MVPRLSEVWPHLHYMVQVAILPVSKDNLSLQTVYINLNWSSCTVIQTHDIFYVFFRFIFQLSHQMEYLQWNTAQHAAVSPSAPCVPNTSLNQANQAEFDSIWSSTSKISLHLKVMPLHFKIKDTYVHTHTQICVCVFMWLVCHCLT